MNCTNCGSPINPGEKFCTNCGSPVKIPLTEPTPPPAVEKSGKKKKPVFKKWWFWVVIVVVVFIILAGILGSRDSGTEPQPVAQQPETTEVAETQESVNTVEEVGEDGFTDSQRELLLQESSLWGLMEGAEYQYKGVLDKVVALDNGGSLVDVYSACKSCATVMQNTWESTWNYSDMPNSSDYIKECQYYVNHIRGVCEDLMDYIDSGSTASLVDAEDGITGMQSYSEALVTARLSFYLDNGFSSDQLAAIMAE